MFSKFTYIHYFINNNMHFTESPEDYKDYKLYEASDIITIPYTELFFINDKLLIELITKEVFHGDFLEAGKNRIDIINVQQLHIPNKLTGTYSFYRNEIARIKYLKYKEKKVEQVQDCSNIKLDKDEYFRLKDLTKKYVYIAGTCLVDPAYCKAIESLNKVEQIGVAAPGILKRDSHIPLLVLSTWQEVFIFDSSNLITNCFYPQIKELFESKNVCKIVHRGAPLIDILKRYYEVFSNNIFDTEIVDLLIQKNENPNEKFKESRNISQCLQAYLNFPNIINDALEVKPEKWSKRPLKESKMVYASKLAVYLILLKEALNDILFAGINLTVDNFCDYYSNITSDYEFSEKFCLNKLSPDLQNLIVEIDTLSLK